MEAITSFDKDSDCFEIIGVFQRIPIRKPIPITIKMTELDETPKRLVKLKDLKEIYGQ